MNALELTPYDLGLAAGLVLVAGAVSILLRLKLEKQLAIAAVRSVVQLLIIGHLLRFVFALEHPLAVLLVLAAMIVFAARAAVSRPARSVQGATWFALITLLLTGFAITGVATQLVIKVQPWYRPQYLIPLLGMLLGNSLTALSLAIDHFLEQLDVRRAEVESDLAMGATKWEAVRRPMSEAVRRGMIPIINAMTVVGIVSLPGMMTGQILAGADPLQAVSYQILIMFMLAASTALTSIAMTYLMYRRVFDSEHRLHPERIRTKA